MKLQAREAKRFLDRPDPSTAGILIYGPEPLLVVHGRDRIVGALAGKGSGNGCDRVPADSLGKNPEELASMIKSEGLFVERRVVCVEGGNDRVTAAAAAALRAHSKGDGWLVVTAGQLRPAAKLRKLFETSDNAVSLPIYDSALSPPEVRSALDGAGLREIDGSAMQDLVCLGRDLPPQVFAQTVAKLALFKAGDDTPVRSEDLEACAPPAGDGSLEGLLSHVIEQRPPDVGPAFRQAIGNGHSPVAILIRARREFRSLFTAASNPNGAVTGVAKLLPPVLGPRRERMLRHISKWGGAGAETALGHLLSADRQLRAAGSRAPAAASVERVLTRLSMMRAGR